MSNASSTHDHAASEATMLGPRRYRHPVSFGRLVLIHLQIWRAQKGVVAGCLLAFAAGLVAVGATMARLSGPVTGAAVGSRFTGLPFAVFSLLWLAVGAIAAAAPIKSGWAAVVLTVAPRRGRWLAACLVSFLLLAVAVTALFAVLAVAVTVAVLAANGQDPAPALAIGRPAGLMLLLVAIQAGVGFLLGAATRSVTASIIIGYVLAPALPAAKFGSVDLGRWLDLNGALSTISAGHPDGYALLSVLSAMALWVVVPALVAWSRLRSWVG